MPAPVCKTWQIFDFGKFSENSSVQGFEKFEVLRVDAPPKIEFSTKKS